MKFKKFFVKPARDGLIIRDPRTLKPLKMEGEMKPRNSYWLRRIKDEDVIIEVQSSSKPKTSKKGEKS
jgi:hypothetical protein